MADKPENANVGEATEEIPKASASRREPKNWDKLVKQFEEDEEKNGEKDANDVFRKIYENADDDMKRAMIKSMQESGGTALSTDWSSVKDKKYEIDPPSGMEYKKWN